MELKVNIDKILRSFFLTLLNLSLSSYCMEEKEIESAVKLERLPKIPKVKSLARIILSKIAAEAIEIYDNKNYDYMDQFIKNKLKIIEFSKISEDFINKIAEIIVYYFGRVDIFGNELIRLYNENPKNSLIAIEFFDKLNDDVKIAITKWLTENLLDYHEFDAIELTKTIQDSLYNINKNNLFELLKSLLQEPHSITFYEDILKTIFSFNKPLNVNVLPSIVNEPAESHYWDKDGNLVIEIANLATLSPAEVQQKYQPVIDKVKSLKLYLERIYTALINIIKNQLEQILKKGPKHEKIFNSELEIEKKELIKLIDQYKDAEATQRSEIEKKIKEFIDKFDKIKLQKIIDYLFLTEPVFLSEVIEQQQIKQDNALDFMKVIYLNEADMVAQLEKIFEMLYEQFPEYQDIVYNKNSALILNPQIKFMNYLIQYLSQFAAIKSIELIQYGNYNDVVAELYSYYSRFGLLFIHKVLMLILGETGQYYNKLEPSIQGVILNNLEDIILKFSKKYGIEKQNFDPELDLINEKLELLKKEHIT